MFNIFKGKSMLPVIFLLLSFFCCHCWIINDIAKSVVDNKEFKDEDESIADQRFNLIYPGTKWCGAGNVADGYDDLGEAAKSDACCRQHDHCPDLIPGRQTKYNLTNRAFYTRLSCDCDETFRQCLRSAEPHEQTARYVAIIYFNALGTQCFREDYPVVKCLKRGGRFSTKCAEYEYDTSAEKIYQWFDVADF